jgi:hypothetical protein
MIALELKVIAALLGGYAVWTFGMFAVALMRGIKRRKEARLSAELEPVIREELAAYVSGAGNLPKLKELCERSRRDVSDVLMSFQGTVAGGALALLCQSSIELGLIHDWCAEARAKHPIRRRRAFDRLAFMCAFEPCRRLAGDLLREALDDPDPEVRFYACRSLAQTGSMAQIGRLFEASLSQPLLTRILLTEVLRRFAVPLCEREVMLALNSENTERVLACLEMLVAWERAVPIPDLHILIRSPDRRIRLLALRLAPLVPLETVDLNAIIPMVMDSDLEAATGAAVLLGRLRVEDALPTLARSLRFGDATLARASAEALALMPPKGWTTLQEMSSSSNPLAAGVASEALAQVRQRGAA